MNTPNAFSLIVKNLSQSVDEATLRAHFQSAGGEVCSLRIPRIGRNNNATSKGYGYINFLQREHAEKALKELNFSELDGKKIHVEWKLNDFDQQKYNKANLIILNLSNDVDEKILREEFEKHGNVLSSKIVTSNRDTKVKNKAYVHFHREIDAQLAITALHNTEFHGSKITVDIFVPSHLRMTNVYVKNLDNDIDSTQLGLIFAPYGHIKSAKVMIDSKTGSSKGFGFVNFGKHEEACIAISNINGRVICSKPLYVCFAEKKEDRHARLQFEHSQHAQQRVPVAITVPNAINYNPLNPIVHHPQPNLPKF